MKFTNFVVRLSILALALFALSIFLISCNSQQNKSKDQKEDSVTNLKAEDFPHLQEQLFALSVADDPAGFAQKFLLDFKEGKIWVKLELKNEKEQLPSGYQIKEHARAGKYVEAQVEVKDLRKLSQEPQIEYISPLQKPLP